MWALGVILVDLCIPLMHDGKAPPWTAAYQCCVDVFAIPKNRQQKHDDDLGALVADREHWCADRHDQPDYLDKNALRPPPTIHEVHNAIVADPALATHMHTAKLIRSIFVVELQQRPSCSELVNFLMIAQESCSIDRHDSFSTQESSMQESLSAANDRQRSADFLTQRSW